MRPRGLVLLSLACAAVGAAVGWGTRGAASPSTARPAAVERALLALDAFERRGERDAASALESLRAAAAAAGPPAGQDTPWREELELVATVASGDEASLWAF